MLRILLLAVLALGFGWDETSSTESESTSTSTEEPLVTVKPCPDGECCNKKGDDFCEGFAEYCEGEDNQNVREWCAKTCNAGPCGPAVCSDCNCYDWDGSNYSNCRPVTLDRICTAYCVKCQKDGITPMPGLYTTHGDECKAYEAENAPPKYMEITSGTCEDVGKDSVQSDDDCKEAIAEVGKAESWNKQTASSSMYKGCFTATGSGKSYYVYDKPSKTYAMSDPKSPVKAGTKPRKTASADYTYYCYTEEAAVGRKTMLGGNKNTWSPYPIDSDKAVGGVLDFEVAPSSTPMIVNVFAAFGLVFILYGAFRHYTQK